MISQRIDTPSGCVLVARMPQLEELEASATAEELQSVASFCSCSRRRERLAWRALLRESQGEQVEVGYKESGAPIISNSLYKYISVSHSRTHVAIVLSHTPCGVDIESLDRDFSKVASRYLCDEERTLCCEEWWSAAVWCAKETLYKVAQPEGVDLLSGLRIEALDSEASVIEARVMQGEPIRLGLKFVEDQMLVYTL